MNRYSCALVARVLATLSMLAACAAPIAATGKPSFDLETLLDYAWEMQWREQGFPLEVTRWSKPISVRYVGDRSARLKEDLQVIVKQFTDITGIRATEVGAEDSTADLTIELKREDSRAVGGVACYAQPGANSRGMAETRVVIIAEYARWCAAHEIGHAFGLHGHPLAKSVMTYFGKSQNLSELDIFFLKGMYSSRVRHGDTPFQLLDALTEEYAQHLQGEDAKSKARESSKKFMDARLAEMDSFVIGKGEPPRVLFRSGRLMPGMVEIGRNIMGVMLTRHYRALENTQENLSQAQKYSEASASRGFLIAMNLLSDPSFSSSLTAHRWASCALAAGDKQAESRLNAIEAKLSTSLRDEHIAQTKVFFDQGKCIIQPKS